MEKPREIEAWFRSTVDAAPINIALYSHDLRLLYVNPALAAACPRPISELLGRQAGEIWGPVLADPLKLHSARALETGERQTYELEMEHPGRTRVVQAVDAWFRSPRRTARCRGSWP